MLLATQCKGMLVVLNIEKTNHLHVVKSVADKAAQTPSQSVYKNETKNSAVKKLTVVILSLGLLSCIAYPQSGVDLMQNESANNPNTEFTTNSGKPVVYQVFTRLFGNTNTTNKPWGTLKENGVGKFSDFTPQALQSIKALGTTHIWYTGVPHHALATSYLKIGITDDDPDVIKGRAGSP